MGIYEFDGLVSILYLCVSANPVFVVRGFGIVRVFTLPFGSILLEFVIFLFYSVFESSWLIMMMVILDDRIILMVMLDYRIMMMVMLNGEIMVMVEFVVVVVED